MGGDTSNGTVSAAEDAARKAQKEVEEADLKVARRKSHMMDMAEYLKTLKAQMKAMKKKLLALKRLGGKRLVAMMKKIAARKKKEAETARDLERQLREAIAEEKARKAAIARLAAAERKAAKVEEAAKRKAAEAAKVEGVAGLFGLATGGSTGSTGASGSTGSTGSASGSTGIASTGPAMITKIVAAAKEEPEEGSGDPSLDGRLATAKAATGINLGGLIGAARRVVVQVAQLV